MFLSLVLVEVSRDDTNERWCNDGQRDSSDDGPCQRPIELQPVQSDYTIQLQVSARYPTGTSLNNIPIEIVSHALFVQVAEGPHGGDGDDDPRRALPRHM